MKPSILHIFPCFAGGGPEVRTTELINRTSDQFRHAVISIHGDLSGRERLAPGVEVPCATAQNPTIWGLCEVIKAHDADAAFTYGWGGVDAIVASRLAGVRRIVHMEDGFLEDERSKQKPSRRMARRILFHLACRIVVPSRTLQAVAQQEWKVADRRLTYIPNGIDGERFRCGSSPAEQAAIRKKLGIRCESVVVGTVSGLRPEKNQLRLVRAFADIADRVGDVHLMIVGDGPLAEPLRADTRRLGIQDRVTFCGATADPAEHYRAMDIFALSSDTEQMPLALLEAMATGLPVVSTNVGDVADMVADVNRTHIVDLDDESAFITALQKLLLGSDLRPALGEANRRRFVENYTLQTMVSSYRELYECATSENVTRAVQADG